MQDSWMSIQGISLHQAWIDEETLLISKGLLGQSGDTGVRKFLTQGQNEHAVADDSEESFLSMQMIICYTKHLSHNIQCKHLINSKAYGHLTDITPISCLAVKLSLSLAAEAVTVHAGPRTALTQPHGKKSRVTHVGVGSHPMPWLLSISNKITNV